MQLSYNKNINFLRFLFSVIIIIFHIFHNNLFEIYGTLNEYKIFAANTSRAYMIVSFFFILSGFYLYNTPFAKMSFLQFTWKKIVRLWPVFAVATILENLPNFSIDMIMRLLFLQCNGLSLQFQGINWFVSSLFWVLLFYCALIKTIDKKYIFFVIGLLVYFCHVHIINHGFYREVKGTFSGGIIQGVGGVGLGYLFHELCQRIPESMLTKLKSKLFYIIISLCEAGLLYFLIYSFLIKNIAYKNNLIFIIAFLPILFSFIFKLGFISKILDNNLSYKLGLYSYAFYVVQQTSFFFSRYIIKKLTIENFYIGVSITLIVSLVLGFFIQYVVNLVQKQIQKTHEKQNKLK